MSQCVRTVAAQSSSQCRWVTFFRTRIVRSRCGRCAKSPAASGLLAIVIRASGCWWTRRSRTPQAITASPIMRGATNRIFTTSGNTCCRRATRAARRGWPRNKTGQGRPAVCRLDDVGFDDIRFRVVRLRRPRRAPDRRTSFASLEPSRRPTWSMRHDMPGGNPCGNSRRVRKGLPGVLL